MNAHFVGCAMHTDLPFTFPLPLPPVSATTGPGETSLADMPRMRIAPLNGPDGFNEAQMSGMAMNARADEQMRQEGSTT